MAAITRDGTDRFQVIFAQLARRGLRRGGPRDAVQVDPFLIGRAIATVMAECTVRSASGQRLLWNEYRVVLARADFEPLRPLLGALERDLRQALATDLRGAELVGELRVTLVVDEAQELEAGRAIVRVAFVPDDRQGAPAAGEMTVRFDTRAVAGRAGPGRDATVHVPDGAGPAAEGLLLRWPAGEAILPAESMVIAGRPHPDPPARFIALVGASARISKQHLLITPAPSSVKIARLPSANPVEVDGRPLAASSDVEVAPPVEISLSRGELILTVTRLPGGRS
jgi:hypothetical protein